MRTIFFIEKELFSREGGFFSYRLVKNPPKKLHAISLLSKW